MRVEFVPSRGFDFVQLEDAMFAQIQEYNSLMKSFFALPAAEKATYAIDGKAATDLGYCEVVGVKEIFQVRLGDGGLIKLPPQHLLTSQRPVKEFITSLFAQLDVLARQCLLKVLGQKWGTFTPEQIARTTAALDEPLSEIISKGLLSCSILKSSDFANFDATTSKALPIHEHADTGLLTLVLCPEDALEVFDSVTQKWKACTSFNARISQTQGCVVLYGEALSRLTNGLVGVTAYRMVPGAGACLAFHLEPQPATVGPRTEADYNLIVLRQQRKKVLAQLQLVDDAWQSVLSFLSGSELARAKRLSKAFNSPKRAGNEKLWENIWISEKTLLKAEQLYARFGNSASWSQAYAVLHQAKAGLTPRDMVPCGLGEAALNLVFDLLHLDLGEPLIDAKHFVSTQEGRDLAKAEGAAGFHEVSSLTQSGLKEMFDTAVRAGLLHDHGEELRKKKKNCAIQ